MNFDTIYLILNLNFRDKGLFSIPRNDEFVYINTGSCVPEDRISEMVKSLIISCESPIVIPEWNSTKKQRPSFNQFLKTHIDSLTTAFDNSSYARDSSDFPCVYVSTTVYNELKIYILMN